MMPCADHSFHFLYGYWSSVGACYKDMTATKILEEEEQLFFQLAVAVNYQGNNFTCDL